MIINVLQFKIHLNEALPGSPVERGRSGLPETCAPWNAPPYFTTTQRPACGFGRVVVSSTPFQQ
jgi:hypothetical protein